MSFPSDKVYRENTTLIVKGEAGGGWIIPSRLGISSDDKSK
jgi:hypothetical protein